MASIVKRTDSSSNCLCFEMVQVKRNTKFPELATNSSLKSSWSAEVLVFLGHSNKNLKQVFLVSTYQSIHVSVFDELNHEQRSGVLIFCENRKHLRLGSLGVTRVGNVYFGLDYL